MNTIFSKQSSVKLPQRSREAQNEEYGREHGGVAACPVCGNVHYKKRWYHTDDIAIERIRENGAAIAAGELCMACRMARDHQFEGEVFIENIPVKYREELANLVRGFGNRAEKQDPQNRIILLEKRNGGYYVTTTEDQLAVRLAKKIREAFKALDIHISYAAEPAEVSRVHVVFKDGA